MQLVQFGAIFFYLLAALVLFFSVFTITSRNAVHCALYLISTLVAIAGLYILLRAEFVAGVQILVYVGGVLVLFLFVIMLVNVRDEGTPIYTKQFLIGTFITFIMAIGIIVVLIQTQRINYFASGPRIAVAIDQGQQPPTETELVKQFAAKGDSRANSRKLSQELYTRGSLPFEIASVILLVAIVGAVRMAREKKQEKMYD